MSDDASNLAPIVLFGYNRPKHIKRTLEALSKNRLASQSRLFIFIDGSKDNTDEESNKAVLNACKNFEWPGLHKEIIRRPRNFGLADNIVDGVTQIVNRYGKIIVVEDDIETSHNFLSYMNDALNYYERNKTVMNINSFVPENRFQNFLPEIFFTRFMNCWGWGTWSDRWSQLELSAEMLFQKLEKRKDRSLFNFNQAINFEQQLIDNIDDKINTWAVKWNATIFLADGLCLNPKRSLVRNIGLDGSGIHYNDITREENKDSSWIAEYGSTPKLVEIKIKENKLARIYLGMHYALGKNPSPFRVSKYFTKRLLKGTI